MQSSPQGKISFSFAGGSSSSKPISPRGDSNIVVSQMQPVRVSPLPKETIVRTQYSPLRVNP